MHSFEVHSNESTCRKSGRLGMKKGIITNNVIDEKLTNFEGLRDLQGGHFSVLCDRVTRRQNFAEVRGWDHLNRKCCNRR